MPVFYRSRGYDFVVIPGDHAPAHVHIEGEGGYVKAWLGDGEVEDWSVYGKVSKSTARKLIKDLNANIDKAWDCWNEFGGSR